MSNNLDNEIKVILVGESGTGKTSLINATMGLKFQEHLETTSTNNFSSKTITINNTDYILNLWDTIGQEKFRSLTKIFIKDSRIALLVYDITNEKSFKELDYWYKIIHDILGDETIIGVCGNKQDLIMKEKVKEEDAKKYAENKGLPFRLTSAKNPLSFNKFLEELVKKYLEKCGVNVGNDNKKTKGINLHGGGKNPEKKKCC